MAAKKSSSAKSTSPKSASKRTSARSSASADGAGVGFADTDAPVAAGSALVIVESPAKAKTIEKYLKDLGKFVVDRKPRSVSAAERPGR